MPTNEERFWKKVAEPDQHDCWKWTAQLKDGYGMFSIMGKPVRAARYAYELLVGAIPAGHQIDHDDLRCHSKACVNPDHLEAVTGKENMQRWQAAMTTCRNGHEKNEENTYTNTRGKTVCRVCKRAREKKAYVGANELAKRTVTRRRS